MRILFLTNDFYPKNPNSVLGGAETITYDLAKGLQRLGHEIHIITGTQDESLDDNIGDFEN